MTVTPGKTLIGLAATCALAACGKTTIVQPPPSLATQSGMSITYTPIGCPYQVITPTGVTSADTGGTVAATKPPDHVHAGFAGDPSTTFAVNWRSEQAATLTEAFYGTDKAAVEAATTQTDTVKVAPGHTLLYTSMLDQGMDPTRVHEVHICGLTPATTYYYKVGNPGAFSAVYSIVTAPAVGSTAPITFAVSGDSRDHADIWAKAEGAIASKGAQFQIFSGDAVEIGQTQSAWNAFFETPYNGVPASDVMANIPMVIATGNHDVMSVNFLAQFPAPSVPGTPGDGKADPKEWYSLNYGPMHITVLDDSYASSSVIANGEAQWLDQDLTAVDRTKTPWVFVVHHRPMYSCSPVHGSDTTLRGDWQPIVDKHKVDVVFNGHVHNYERTNPIRGFMSGSTDGQIVGSYNQGTMYVVAAGVGADLYGIGTTCAFTAKTEQTEPYLILTVTPTTLTMTAYRLQDGSTLDSVTINKAG